MMNSVLLSFKQSLSLIMQHLIASTQSSMELTASNCEDVESAIKKDTVGCHPHMRGLEEVTLNDLK